MLRQTHTVVIMDVPWAVFELIAAKLREAGYDHVFMDADTVDLSGIALQASTEAADVPLS